jgi:nicotinate-nucleotide adenylyltransferase
MSAETRVGLLGGTLDPIHLGHIETALAALRALRLDRAYVLPSNVPPHRTEQPVASSYHRFAMTALAVNGRDGLLASDLELTTPGTSYTADTLTRFREASGLTASQVFFITGADAFAEIATWHRYPEVLDLAHFVVVSRPGVAAESLRQQLGTLASRMISVTPDDSSPEPRTATTESRTANREPRTASREPRVFLVNAATPDVSSTEIRKRLMAGRSIAGLVPPGVQRHIAQHGLYSGNPGSFAADHLHDEN